MKRKSEKGATTLFVLIAGLSFIAFLTTVLAISAVRRQSQLEATKQSKEIYSKGDANTIYENFFASDGAVPIYTFEQFKKICTGEQVAINEENGKYYTFSNDAVYVLMNDLIGENTGIYPMPNTFANTGRLEKNGKSIKIKDLSKPEEVYYYYNSSNDYAFPLTKEGYSYNGLMLCYDGTNNTGDGHSNTATTWKDLSGNGNDGTLNGGATWNTDSICLDGVDDWVSVGQMNYENITLETVIKFNQHSMTSQNAIIGNVESGGYGLLNFNEGTVEGKNGFTVRINNQYYSLMSDYNITDNKFYRYTGSYDGNTMKYWENDEKYERNISGTINDTINNTVMAVGCNPQGNQVQSGKINGNIYAARVYNRALTDEEVAHNAKIDKTRVNFEIEANAPIVPTGNMNVQYVTWREDSGTYVEQLYDSEPRDWYNYSEGKWANIKTIAKTPIDENAATLQYNEAYWVWIPRYAYKVPERPTEDNYTNNPTFEIAFLDGVSNNPIDPSVLNGATIKDVYPDGEANSYVEVGDWVVHPAFNYGGIPLAGIWVAKFEASSNNPNATNGGGNTTSLYVNSKPDVIGWRYIRATNIYTVCKNMKSSKGALAGVSTSDPHMMKNVEWGAIAYLTQSKYGQMRTSGDNLPTGRVWINPNSNYKTGQAGSGTEATAGMAETTSTDNYNIGNGPKASTTGNVYGIYDMAGGSWERVAAYVNSEEAQTNTYITNLRNAAGTTYVEIYDTDALIEANNEATEEEKRAGNYAKLYTIITENGQSKLRFLRWGDAVIETSYGSDGTKSFQQGNSFFPCTEYPLFSRGGRAANAYGTGVFAYADGTGTNSSLYGFRPVCIAP